LREEDKRGREDLEEDLIFFILVWEFLKEEEEIGRIVFGELSQGTGVARNFGLGGQETTRIPGAREPERLFLVGWEVNIQLGSLGKVQNKRTRDKINQPAGRGKYFIMLMLWFCWGIYFIMLFISLLLV
jgi:hypothetical protein